MFIGLNPSTANDSTDDNTIRRVKKMAFEWGFGGVYMANLFTYISTDPAKLDPYGNGISKYIGYIQQLTLYCDTIIFAWGNFPQAIERGKIIADLYDGYALELNKNGSPKHPLYVKSNIRPVNYKDPTGANGAAIDVCYRNSDGTVDVHYSRTENTWECKKLLREVRKVISQQGSSTQYFIRRNGIKID